MARAPTPAASGGAADPDPGTDTRGSAKAGRSVAGTAARHAAFVEAYMTNGHNATAAAIAIGCAGTQLANAGWKLLQNENVQQMLAVRARQVAADHALSTTNIVGLRWAGTSIRVVMRPKTRGAHISTDLAELSD